MAFFGLFGKERKREDLIREKAQQLTEDYQKALAQKNEKIKEQAEAHKGQPWPGMDPVNRVKTVMNTPHKLAPVVDPVSEDRKKELGNIIFSPQIGEDDLEDVTTQEILFILNALDGFQKRTPLENYEENRRTVYEALLSRIRRTAWIYTLYDQSVGYPLLESGAAMIYFDEEHARQAVNLYRAQLRAANVLRLFGEDKESWPQGRRVISAFELFYYLGIERVIVENGWYRAEVRREDLLQCWKWTDKERQEHQAAPALSYAMTEYAQERVWPLRYNGKQQVLKKKFEEVVHQLVPAQLFLIPMQESEQVGLVSEGETDRKEEPLLVTVKEKKGEIEKEHRVMALFTDRLEYERWLVEYRKNKEMKAVPTQLLSFDWVVKHLGNAEGMIINPAGQKILINTQPQQKTL